MAQKVELELRLAKQQQENEQLKTRNETIAREVSDLRNGLEGIEEKARSDLGMVKEGETFYMVLEKSETVAEESQQ